MRLDLRDWQRHALAAWDSAGHRGIAAVVTGAGKTVFALSAIARLQADTTLVIVPTLALLDQWWEEASSFFDLSLDEISILRPRQRLTRGTINIGVLNTAAKLPATVAQERGCFLIADECHRAAAAQLRAALGRPTSASLGLSATPERAHDDWLDEVLVPALGPIIYRYEYGDALRDGVIVPFLLRNIVFDLEPERQEEYDRLTKAIARSIARRGYDDPRTVALLLRRARVLNMSLNRVKLALKLVAANRGRRILVFHEDIQACELIRAVLVENGLTAGVYHSRLTLRARADVLAAYRRGDIGVLVTCRALDEGFNVPETQVGIIAASTATRRQRIQRLGRVLRPASGKEGAVIYTLVATDAEISRLRKEEIDLQGVADVSWGLA